MALTILGWLFTGLLLVLLITCVIAGRGGIPLNRYFGVRLPALMRSDSTWRAGHAAGVLPAAVAFVVALVCAVVGIFAPPVQWGVIIAFVCGVIPVMVSATRAAKRV